MSLYLSKIVPQFLMPLALSIELLLLGIFLLRRRPRAARALLALALFSVWVPATPRISDALLRGLETGYPVTAAAASREADAIVVLGGGTSGRSERQPEPDLGQSGSRLLHAFRLYRAGKAPLLILSGGGLYAQKGDTEAEQMRQILGAWGVPTAAMVLEPRSMNTRENAVETLRIARQRGLRRLLLVTSAFHMPRALGLFRKLAGDLELVPSPTGQYSAHPRPYLLWDLLPDAGSLANSTLALRERLGYFMYRLRGWI